jgi:energy-coupling factor transport system ATP-binding protein
MKVEKGEFVLITVPVAAARLRMPNLQRTYSAVLSRRINWRNHSRSLDAAKHPTYEMAKTCRLGLPEPRKPPFRIKHRKGRGVWAGKLGAQPRRNAERVQWALNLTGISDLYDRSPHEVSGGQQQRVAIAAVLAMQPEIIVLDEPTSFLDPLSAQKIFEVIHSLNKQLGLTVVLVEHRLDLTAKYADHIIIMDKGKVRFDGKTREVLSNEEARLLGVGIPKSTLLYELLQKEGANLLGETPLAPEELAKMLKEALK